MSNQYINGQLKLFVMKGGPWDGMSLSLRYPGTLPIDVKGQKGHYNSDNQWVPKGTVDSK